MPPSSTNPASATTHRPTWWRRPLVKLGLLAGLIFLIGIAAILATRPHYTKTNQLLLTYRVENGKLVSGPKAAVVANGKAVQIQIVSHKQAEELDFRIDGLQQATTFSQNSPSSLEFTPTTRGKFPITLHDEDGHSHQIATLEVK